jgi:hypothetical protein
MDSGCWSKSSSKNDEDRQTDAPVLAVLMPLGIWAPKLKQKANKRTVQRISGSVQLSSTSSGCHTRCTYLTLTQPVTTCDRREDDNDEDGDDEDVEDKDDEEDDDAGAVEDDEDVDDDVDKDE